MLTTKDLTKLQELFVTRDEFLEFRTEIFQTFATKAEMMERFDAVMHELKAIREDITVFAYRQQEHSDQLERHDAEIKDLQSSAGVSTTRTT